MNIIKKLINTGIQDFDSPNAIKKAQMINLCCIFSICMIIGLIVFFTAIRFEPLVLTFFSSALLMVIITLALSAFRKFLLSKFFFVTNAYLIIYILSVVFGKSSDFHFYLIPGIAVPLVFFGEEMKNLKWVLAAIGIPMWFYIEINFNHLQPVLSFTSEQTFWISFVNISLMFSFLITLFYGQIKLTDAQVEKIDSQRNKLKLLNENLEQFAYIVSHDLKAPLQNITAMSDLMLKENYANEKSANMQINFIKERSEKMEELITSILEYSKLVNDDGKSELIKFNELFENVISPYLETTNIKFEISPTNSVIRFNPTHLTQVFSNLISNAVKYQDKESGLVEIKFHLDSKLFTIEIKDNGQGIPDHFKNDVFTIFRTAHGQLRSDSTGVGLSIVKKIVELNQGEIRFESEEGVGTTFFVSFPAGIMESI